MPEKYLITGSRETGKTLLCERMIEEFSSAGFAAKGILSIKRTEIEGGRKIFARNIESNTEREIAIYNPGWDEDFPKRDWQMNHKNLEWADAIIRKSVPADILFIDELGYLELQKGSGLVSSFEILESGKYSFAFIVVRPSLFDLAKKKMQIDGVIYINPSTDIEKTAISLSDQVLNKLNK